MKKFYAIILAVLIMCTTTVAFSNGLSLNSPGPKALGMGGAMIGIANDYTTIYWNPAGMTNIDGIHIGAYYTAVIPSGTYKADLGQAKIDAETKTNIYPAPGIMGYYPLMNGDLTVGLGVYVPAGLGAEWDGAILTVFSADHTTAFKWMNQIGAITISPGAAYKITDMLSVGAALNINYAMLDMDRPMDVTGDGAMDVQYSESSTGIGLGVFLGVLFSPIDLISVGLSYKTKSTAAMTGDATNPAMAATGSATSEFDRDLAWPQWFGGGVAIKPMDGLTIALDAQWSQWSESENELETEYKDWPDITTMPPGPAPLKQTMEFKWEDAIQVRFGLEYELSKNFALRTGFYTDPAPGPDETYSIVFPSISYNAVTFGASYDLGFVGIDFGIEYLIGEERDIKPNLVDPNDPTKGVTNMMGLHNMNILATNLGIHLGL